MPKNKRKTVISNLSINSSSAQIIDLTGEQAQSIARQVLSQRTTKKTRQIYKGKLKKWIDYFISNYPEILSEITDENGDISVNLDLGKLEVVHVLAFLGNETKWAIEIQQSEISSCTVEFLELAGDKTVYAYQTISGHVSALKSEYRDAKIDMSTDMKTELDNFLCGYKKIIADLRSQGKYSVEEGKKCIRFNGYISLLQLFLNYCPFSDTSYLKRGFQLGTFCVIFIILSWNLAQRSETIASIHLEHIKWVGDSLCIRIPRTKNDQTGEKSDADDDGKHIYANPMNPLICPISNLGIYVFTTPRVCNKLFSGVNQHVRYGTALRELLRHLLATGLELLKTICDSIENIGTHSFRKGAATYALQFSGMFQLTDLYLRVGWTLGNVQDRYIFQTPGGDQCLGRVLAGLSPYSNNFAMLPPHFDPEDLANLTVDDWCDVYPAYTSLPDCFKEAIPFLLASVYYHETYYRTTLHDNHPLLLSSVFQSRNPKILKLRQNIYCDVNQCLKTTLIASGVPQIFQLAIRLSKLEETFRDGNNDVINMIRELSSEMPRNISEYLRNNGQVEGSEVQRVDLIAFEARLNSSYETRFVQLVSLIASRSEAIGNSSTSVAITSNLQVSPATEVIDGKWFYWEGRWNRLPENYLFPLSMYAKHAWDLYYFGEIHHRLGPFKNLEQRDFSGSSDTSKKGSKNQLINFCKARCVICVIAVLALKEGKFTIVGRNFQSKSNKTIEISRALSKKSFIEMNNIFECGYEKLLSLVHPSAYSNYQKSRAAIQLSCNTLHKHIKAFEKSSATNLLCDTTISDDMIN